MVPGRRDAHDLGRMLVMSCAALHWLYGLGRSGLLLRRLSALQLQVCMHAVRRLIDAATLLDQALPYDGEVEGGYDRMASSDPVTASPPLNAEQLDSFDVSGQLDPLFCKEPDALHTVQAPRCSRRLLSPCLAHLTLMSVLAPSTLHW